MHHIIQQHLVINIKHIIVTKINVLWIGKVLIMMVTMLLVIVLIVGLK